MGKPACICVFICSALASAQNWTVKPDGSGDFITIQSAIDTAVSGDIVEIADGIYSGEGNRNISFLGKAITVKSKNGPDRCIIDGSTDLPDRYRGFIFESEETRDSVLEGVTIRNFWYLTCCDGGAGIYIAHGDPVIRNCSIIACRVELDACPCIIYGGGISVSQGTPLIERCLIIGNSINGNGGGISCSDGLYPASTLVFLKNCVIARNEGYGGGIYLFDFREAVIENCTIVNNQNYGIICEYFEITPLPTQLRECILWGNIPNQVMGYNLMTNLNYTPNIGPATRPEPKFVDPLHNDYHLQWDSPCIDFCRYAASEPNETDGDGEPRYMGEYIDAGADEVGPKQADFSRSGRVGIEDFTCFAAAWGSSSADPDWYLLCDLHQDDVIDLNDLEMLAKDWLWQAAWFNPQSYDH